MFDNFIPNHGTLQIYTDTGFQDFKGILTKKYTGDLYHITTEHGISLSCSAGHKIYYTMWQYEIASNFKVDDFILVQLPNTDNVIKSKIINITIEAVIDHIIYDPLEVSNGHRWLANYSVGNQCLYIDEFAFIANDTEFYTSTYPVITAGKTTKVILTSTPKGMNLFYKLWTEAEQRINDYVPYQVRWQEHPDRDEKWYKEQSANLSAVQISQEFECVGGDTMININGSDIMIKNLHGKYSNVLWK